MNFYGDIHVPQKIKSTDDACLVLLWNLYIFIGINNVRTTIVWIGLTYSGDICVHVQRMSPNDLLDLRLFH